jgi:hypothetical protein
LILWQKAIPARQRIKDVEEVLKREFIDTINPAEIQSIDPRVISSAAEELLVTIPTVNTFYRMRESIRNFFHRMFFQESKLIGLLILPR